MRITKVLSPLFAAVVGFAVIVPAAPVVAAPTAQVVSYDQIKGRILTNTGEALTDALVSVVISGSTETVISARTRSDGSYKLSVPNIPGIYTLRIIRMGYSPVTMSLAREGNGWNAPEEIAMRPITVDLLGNPTGEAK